MALTKATFSMIQGACINILDYGCVGDNSTNNLAAFQAAINAAGDLGIKRVYVPAGIYLMQLTTGIGVQDSAGNTINGFEIFGDGASSELKLGLSSGANFEAFLGFGKFTSGVIVRDLAFNFNAARAPLRPSPSARFHNPAILMSKGGENIRINNCTFIDASVDQPIRLASFTSPSPANEYVNDVVIENCRFERFGDGVPSNDQADISCIFMIGNQVRISKNYFNSKINTISGSKGLTAIECYGQDYVISNNNIIAVNTAHIVGNQQGPQFTANILINGNSYRNIQIIVNSITRTYATGEIEFSNNSVVVNAGTVLGTPAFVDANFFGGAQPSSMTALVIKDNYFNYANSTVATPGTSLTHLLTSCNTALVEFTGNTVLNHPSGIFYTTFYDSVDQEYVFRNNVFENIRTVAAAAGAGTTAVFYEVAGVLSAFDFSSNYVVNWLPKASRAGTGYLGPLVAILFSATGKNLLITNNTVLGANTYTDNNGAVFTSKVTTGLITGTQTD
jgi:hypothetical protein